jgi:2,5-furandicarboxylate decarboxylase 1
MSQDLRGFLQQVKEKKPDDFVVISREIDPAYEITALVVKLERERKRRPVLLFEKVQGCSFPVLTNLHASRSRLAAAMGCAPDATLPTYLRAMEDKLPPRVVASGPVQKARRWTSARCRRSSITRATPART